MFAFRLSFVTKPKGVFCFGKRLARELREWARIEEKIMEGVLFKEESYKIIGACFEVYNNKGSGFTEPIYQECLQHEFSLQGIPFVVPAGNSDEL